MSRTSRYNLLSQQATQWFAQKTYTISGEEVQSNNIVLTECFTAWLFLIEDLHMDSNESHRSKLEYEWALAVNSAGDIAVFLKCCKDLYDMLLSSLSGKSALIYRDFKDHIRSNMQYRGILTPIRHELKFLLNHQSCYICGDLDEEQKHLFKSYLCRVAQYLLFPTKLVLVNPLLEEQAIVDYMATEAENQMVLDRGCDPSIINEMGQILTEWLRGFHVDINLMKHGNGATADAAQPCLLTKYMKMCTDPKINLLFNSFEIGKRSYLTDFAPLGLQENKLLRQSTLLFVPKNCTKLRSISMEPTLLQFTQQGVMQSLKRWFEHHPYIKRIIKLDDQSQNRFLAYFGSYNDSLSTIDMSHASDSVVWEIVKDLFRGTPELYKWLIATRSDTTLLPNGDVVRLTKYAPMGSALSFPIETLVFAAAVETIARRRKKKKLNTHYDSLKTRSMPPYSVYGDDIIVPREWYDDVVALLSNIGFTVNDNKSYRSGLFKESCGINCFDAVDITPLKYCPKWMNRCTQSNGMAPEAYTAHIAYANFAYTHKYKMFRSYCINRIKASGIKPYFTSDLDDMSGIYSKVPNENLNYHLSGKDLGRCSTVSAKADEAKIKKIIASYFNNCKGSYTEALEKVRYHACLQKGPKVLVGANMELNRVKCRELRISMPPKSLTEQLLLSDKSGSHFPERDCCETSPRLLEGVHGVTTDLTVWEGFFELSYDSSIVTNGITNDTIGKQFTAQLPSFKSILPSVVKIGRKTVIKDKRRMVVTEDHYALGLIDTINS